MMRRGEACLALVGVAHHRWADHQQGEACLAPTDFGLWTYEMLFDLVVFLDSILVAALLHVKVAAHLVEAH